MVTRVYMRMRPFASEGGGVHGESAVSGVVLSRPKRACRTKRLLWRAKENMLCVYRRGWDTPGGRRNMTPPSHSDKVRLARTAVG